MSIDPVFTELCEKNDFYIFVVSDLDF